VSSARGAWLADLARRTSVAGIATLVAAAVAVIAGAPADAALTTRDIAADVGIAVQTTSWSATVTDVNGDGVADFLLGRHIDVARLYQGDGSAFTEIDAGGFGVRDRHNCAAADVDQDGRTDVYCAIGANGGRIEKSNELWMQQPDGTFVDEAQAFGVADRYGRGRSVTFLDLDHDAYPDLFVGNTYPRRDGRRSPNRLFVNDSGTGFEEVHHSGVTRELGARCAQAVDVNADGWDDLLVCGKQGRPLRLYRNDRHDGFVDVTGSHRIRGQAAGAQIVDVDGNGTLDLVRVSAQAIKVQLGGAHGFRKPAYVQPLKSGVWVAVGDVNRDGLQDLYVVQGCGGGQNLPDYLLIGHGRDRFTRTSIPQARQGCGGFAAPIDYNDDGRTEFLVLNGQGRLHQERVTGPVQLIEVGG
jgi:hypothetical protein